MNNFLISLSHSCMHGRGNIRVLEGVVELRMRPLLAWDRKRNMLCFFVEAHQKGWLIWIVIVSIR